MKTSIFDIENIHILISKFSQLYSSEALNHENNIGIRDLFQSIEAPKINLIL